MKKFKKLLSVLLAMIMILSTMSVMAFAYSAKPEEYSPYGTVTRISTADRAKLILDGIDKMLGDMGLVVDYSLIDNAVQTELDNYKVSWLVGGYQGAYNMIGIRNTTNLLDATSIDALLRSLDDLFYCDGSKHGLLDFALENMDDVSLRKLNGGNLSQNWWNNNGYKGMSRATTGDIALVSKLIEYIALNKDCVTGILNDKQFSATVTAKFAGIIDIPIKLHDIVNGIDIDGNGEGGDVNTFLSDIPRLVKSILFGIMTRWDDTTERAEQLEEDIAGDGKVQKNLDIVIQNLLTKPMSIGTFTADANGNCTSSMTLPGANADTRYRYVMSEDKTQIQVQYYVPVAGKDTDGVTDLVGAYVTDDPNELYTRELIEGTEPAEYKYVNEDTGYELQYYYDGSYALRSLQKKIDAGEVSIKPGTQSAAQVLFNFIPSMFEDMATVVLNGSVKKVLAEWFGAYFIYEGEKDELATSDIPAGILNDVFFTQPQGDYIWGWSDYKIIDGIPYYRYQDSFYRGVIDGTNEYYGLFNWDYKIPGNLFDEFLPIYNEETNTWGKSAAGYDTILQGLNDWLIKVVNIAIAPEHVAAMGLKKGDNSKLVENAKNAAQYVVGLYPARIFGSDPTNDPYYQLMMNPESTNQEILSGLACTIIKLVMPQFILPPAANFENENVGAILAAVVRELATQIVPDRNYDSLIYADGNYVEKKFVAGNQPNSYWLDVILTMAMDMATKYAKNYVDLGEGTTAWAKGMDNWSDEKVDVTSIKMSNGIKTWEGRLDYLLDWALCDETYGMKFNHILHASNVDLATPQSPWAKVGDVVKAVFPVEDVFNIDTTKANWLETLLVDDFFLAIANLELEKIAGGATANGILNVKSTSILKTTNTYDALVKVIRDFLNNLIKQATGTTLIPDTVTHIDEVFWHSNIAAVVGNLLPVFSGAVPSDGGILVPVLYFANMFIGENVASQEFDDPTLTVKNTENLPYAYSNGSTVNSTINIRNNSNGVLLKHGDKYDQPYNIVVDSITSDYGNVSITADSYTIGLGENKDFAISMPYTSDGPAIITVKYHFTFLDGKTLGDPQEAMTYTYVSKNKTNIPTGEVTVPGNWNYTAAYSGFKATQSRYIDDVNQLSGVLSALDIYVGHASSGASTSGENYTGFDARYIASTGATINGINSGGKTIYPAQLAEGADLSTIKSGDAISLGSYTASFKWGGRTATHTMPLGNVYYANVKEIEALFASVSKEISNLNLFDESAVAEKTAFKTAIGEAAKYALAPKMSETFTTTYTQENLDKAVNDLKKAVEDLKAKPATGAAYDVLEKALVDAKADDTNYQDFRLFEYFQYDAVRMEVWGRVAEYKAAIENDTDLPTYSDLSNKDLAQKLVYYRGFVEQHKKATEKQFLEKELAYAAAQNYDETAYTTESWTNYTDALNAANAVNGDATSRQSDVFEAKYNLMVAQNQLALQTADPEIKPIEGTDGFVDTENMYLYGIPAESDINAIFEGIDGELVLKKNAAGFENGTGAQVELWNTGKTQLVATYTIIVFGDINGDAAIDATDFSAMQSMLQGIAFDQISTIAADVADATDINNPTVDASDFSAMQSALQGIPLPVNPYA